MKPLLATPAKHYRAGEEQRKAHLQQTHPTLFTHPQQPRPPLTFPPKTQFRSFKQNKMLTPDIRPNTATHHATLPEPPPSPRVVCAMV